MSENVLGRRGVAVGTQTPGCLSDGWQRFHAVGRSPQPCWVLGGHGLCFIKGARAWPGEDVTTVLGQRQPLEPPGAPQNPLSPPSPRCPAALLRDAGAPGHSSCVYCTLPLGLLRADACSTGACSCVQFCSVPHTRCCLLFLCSGSWPCPQAQPLLRSSSHHPLLDFTNASSTAS